MDREGDWILEACHSKIFFVLKYSVVLSAVFLGSEGHAWGLALCRARDVGECSKRVHGMSKSNFITHMHRVPTVHFSHEDFIRTFLEFDFLSIVVSARQIFSFYWHRINRRY